MYRSVQLIEKSGDFLLVYDPYESLRNKSVNLFGLTDLIRFELSDWAIIPLPRFHFFGTES